MINAISYKKCYFGRPADFFREGRTTRHYIHEKRKLPKDCRLRRDLREKIMLAVSIVMNCKYCSYLHTRTSLEHGVGEEEIKNLMKGELGDFPAEEAKALAYAQHFSEARENVSQEAKNEIINSYGEEKTLLIEYYAQLVYMGNMICNTVDAYHQNADPPGGKSQFFMVYLICLPIAFFIRIYGNKGKKFLTNQRISID